MTLLLPAATNVGFFDLEFSTDGGTTWTGWMLARNRNGAPMYREEEQDVVGGVAAAVPQSQLWSDLSDGMGLKLHRVAGEGIERRYFDVGADAEFGGLDASVEGKLLLPQKMTATTVYSGSHAVRALCYFPGTGKYYAGIDDRLYESTNGTFTDATQVSSGAPSGANILDLIAFQGNNAVSLLYIARDGDSAYAWDGTTFTQVGGTGGYQTPPTAVYFYDDSATTYTDYTAAVTDSAGGTAADISSMTSADSLIVGYSEPFTKINPYNDAPATPNSNASVATADYWNGTAWVAVTGFTDTTSQARIGDTTIHVSTLAGLNWTNTNALSIAGEGALTISGAPVANGDGTYAVALSGALVANHAVGTTITNTTRSNGATIAKGSVALSLLGTMSWTRPSGWAKAQLTATGSAAARYYIRIRVSATLDASTTLREIDTVVFSEASAWAVRGKDLGRIFDKNRLAIAEDGGVTPTWNSQPDPAGDYAGTPVGLVATNDSWFFKSTTGFHSWTATGEPISYLPDLAYAPEPSTARGFTSWAGLVWMVHGGMWRFDPVGGVPAPFGPETLGAIEAVPTFTSLVGDRDYALYGCGLTAGGTDSWLWKYTGVAQDGRPKWHKQQYLGVRTIYASATWTVSGQPYLVMGDGAGKVLCRKLAKTGNPLDAGSGADYQDGIYGYLQLATFVGHGQEMSLVSGGASFSGRNIDSVGNLLAVFQTKQPQATSWATQFTAVGYGRTVFATPYSGLGIDQRIALRTSDTTKSPVIEGTWLHYFHRPRRVLTVYRLTLLLSDGALHPVHDRSGAPLRGQDGLLSALNAADATTTFTLRLPGGGTDTVRCQSFSSVLVPTKRNQPARRGVNLTLSSVG